MMATGVPHLDRVLDHLDHVERKSRTEWTALCPAHADTNPSLVITVSGTDKLLLHCRDGCPAEKIVAAIGLTMMDLFALPTVLTVGDLARAKGLPEEFLLQHGLRAERGVIYIPYRDAAGDALRERVRLSLTGRPKYKWAKKGTGAYAFGLWQLPTWRGRGLTYLIIGEGETDALACWYHQVPFLGVPGCSMAKTIELAHLEGLTTLYVCQEPGAGGQALVKGMQARLRALGFTGQVFILTMPDGIKDLCELHQRSGEHFTTELQMAMQRAVSLDITPDRRPTILITQDLERETAEAWEATEAGNEPTLFVWGTGLARLAQAVDGSVTAERVDVDALSHFLKRVAHWQQLNQRGEIVGAYLPLRVVRDMLKQPAPPLPHLELITEVPVLTPAGTLLLEPGYDPDSRIYYQPPPDLVLPPVPPVPTAADVAEAKRLLLTELLGDFPFLEPADDAGGLALLLTRFVRPYIPGPTPLFMIEKPRAGSGAGLLTDAVVLLTTGRPAPMAPEGDEKAEWRKRITALLLTGQPFGIFDNLHETLDSAALASVVAARTWQDRVLGKTALTQGLPVKCTWIATANNPTIGGADIGRRIIPVRLDSQLEHPELRSGFRHPNLLAFVQAARPQLLSSVLVLLQHWVAQGRPPGPLRLGSFEDWAATLSGILAAADVPDLGANQQRFREQADVNSDEDRHFVRLWWGAYQGQAATIGGLPPHSCGLFMLLLRPDAPLLEGLTAATEEGKKVQLGKVVLPRLRGRRFEVAPGVVVVVERVTPDAHTKTAAWRLVRVEDALGRAPRVVRTPVRVGDPPQPVRQPVRLPEPETDGLARARRGGCGGFRGG